MCVDEVCVSVCLCASECVPVSQMSMSGCGGKGNILLDGMGRTHGR